MYSVLLWYWYSALSLYSLFNMQDQSTRATTDSVQMFSPLPWYCVHETASAIYYASWWFHLVELFPGRHSQLWCAIMTSSTQVTIFYPMVITDIDTGWVEVLDVKVRVYRLVCVHEKRSCVVSYSFIPNGQLCWNDLFNRRRGRVLRA